LGEEVFEIDHFRPVRKFPDHKSHYPNLYYACVACNRHKGNTWPPDNLVTRGYRFADPCEEDLYATHVEEASDGTLSVRTRVGDYTCQHIRLNRAELVAWRRGKREAAVRLPVLEALREQLARVLEATTEPTLHREIQQKLAALDAIVASERARYQI